MVLEIFCDMLSSFPQINLGCLVIRNRSCRIIRINHLCRIESLRNNNSNYFALSTHTSFHYIHLVSKLRFLFSIQGDWMLLNILLMSGISFWVLLRSPFVEVEEPSETTPIITLPEAPQSISEESFCSRIQKIPLTFKYMAPLFMNFYFVYVINQGLVSWIKQF